LPLGINGSRFKQIALQHRFWLTLCRGVFASVDNTYIVQRRIERDRKTCRSGRLLVLVLQLAANPVVLDLVVAAHHRNACAWECNRSGLQEELRFLEFSRRIEGEPNASYLSQAVIIILPNLSQ